MPLALSTPSTAGMSIPIPPASADLEALHRWALSLSTWLGNLHLQGLQASPITQTELNNMVSANDLTQSGKLFSNVTDGLNYQSTVVSNTLTITAI